LVSTINFSPMINSDIKKQQPYLGLIRNSSYLTDVFPSSGGRLIDSFVYGVGGSKMWSSIMSSTLTTKMHSIRTLESILVVSDLNIGDAVITQAVVSGIRDFLPHSKVDFIITRSAGDLIKGNPEVTNLYPVFTGRPFPNINDFIELKRIVAENKYDLVVNLCPMFNRKKDFGDVNIIHGHHTIGPEMLKNETTSSEINHIIFQTNLFINKLLSNKYMQVRNNSFNGVSVNISDSAIAKSIEFISGIKFKHPDHPVIYFNPDASSPFTTIPLKYQIDLISQLLDKGCNILLGCGYSSKGIEKSILSSLHTPSSDNITLVPYSTSLDEMAAIVDRCDVYFGGDTGPLHIAASKKVSSSGNISFRNKTAIFAVFGATPIRIYGYDSVQPGFLAANQNAPSRVYAALSPCQNITCVDKKNKVCKVVRCFESLNTKQIVSDISLYLDKLNTTGIN
jgi:ADP-heptose:LPS heptosyltransferase